MIIIQCHCFSFVQYHNSEMKLVRVIVVNISHQPLFSFQQVVQSSISTLSVGVKNCLVRVDLCGEVYLISLPSLL